MNILIDGIEYTARVKQHGLYSEPELPEIPEYNGTVKFQTTGNEPDYGINSKANISGLTLSLKYDDMVRRLFKKLDSTAAMAHHATTGICGEVAELLSATDRKNVIEECGDILFYLTALRHQLKTSMGQINLTKEVTTSPFYTPRLSTVLTNLASVAGDLLDLTKKSWVYEKELNEYAIWQNIALFEINITFLFNEVFGLSKELIMRANMEKLGQRYSTGSYSDEQANLRADKA